MRTLAYLLGAAALVLPSCALTSPSLSGRLPPSDGAALAPPVVSDQWINSPPLAWADLRGRVVMVEFWTYG